MSRRIDVELTSQNDDGIWTWRAAGAKQPKGTLDGSLLYSGASVGDVCRADADFEIDGIFITAVLPPKGRSGRPDDERIELLGSSTEFQGVTTQLAKKGRSGKKRDGRRRNDGKERKPKGAGRERDDKGRKGSRDAKPRKPKADTPSKPKPKKLKPGRTHRKALIDGLPEEQRVIAEQVSRGGIAAVRKEIEEQNRRAEEEGTEAVRADALLALAESLVPQIKVAEWRDRADAALKSIADVDIRDLRAVIVAAEDFARDDESRALADEIRSGLSQRVESDQVKWQDEIREALKEERVVRALRLSSRPPKAGSPLPPDIAESLASQANQALGGDVSQQRIGIVLEAVAFSPIRPYVAIAHIPPDPGKELLDLITKVSDRIPDIAKQFGIEPVEKARGKRRPKPQKGAKTAEDGTKDEAATSSDDSGADERTNSSTEEQVSTSTEEALSSSDADVAEVHDAETPEAEADQGADAPPEEPPSENVTKEVD
ncbi:MAG TPA: hypothetical protein DEB59_01095 [Acidimicrobiaceae bacterium]|nr:hypothetical protein [Acidimicrobiaceae bacterium]|tara:strand:- start:3412 stop:4872 length:1461 start_codon:yes stop_codon:yes gene_type:complete